MKPAFTPGRGGVNAVQKQHVEVHAQIECTAKLLDQRHRTGLRGLPGKFRLLYQLTHQLRAAGEQEF